jgi:hypothetical protein
MDYLFQGLADDDDDDDDNNDFSDTKENESEFKDIKNV